MLNKFKDQAGFTTLEITITIALTGLFALMMLLLFQQFNFLHHFLLGAIEKELETARIYHLVRPQSVEYIREINPQEIVIRYDYQSADTLSIAPSRRQISRNGLTTELHQLKPLNFNIEKRDELLIELKFERISLSWIIERNPFH